MSLGKISGPFFNYVYTTLSQHTALHKGQTAVAVAFEVKHKRNTTHGDRFTQEDLFATFEPTDPETEYEVGVIAVTLTAAYVVTGRYPCILRSTTMFTARKTFRRQIILVVPAVPPLVEYAGLGGR
jgi:hypothetical protein